jgi:K+-transporting ATPase KdpF subunit
VRRLRPFLRKGALNRLHPYFSTMETIFISLIALALLAYLVVAVLRPEKF